MLISGICINRMKNCLISIINRKKLIQISYKFVNIKVALFKSLNFHSAIKVNKSKNNQVEAIKSITKIK